MAYHLNPGPNNDELLWMGADHRSVHVFRGLIDNNLTLAVKRADQIFFDLIKKFPIPAEVENILIQEGFGGVLQVGCIRMDHSLITAIVEKWRPETHTFHFPCGEATITLQDVQVLWGLPVGGLVITGNDNILSREDYVSYITNLLGFMPRIKDSKIVLKDLRDEMQRPVMNELQRARVYILHLIGGTLFPDKSGNMVHVCWLENLAHIGTNLKQSWGSAVLASLYKNLCKLVTNTKLKEISGPMTLLQPWAWVRISDCQPKISRRHPTPDIRGKVLGVRYVSKCNSCKVLCQDSF